MLKLRWILSLGLALLFANGGFASPAAEMPTTGMEESVESSSSLLEGIKFGETQAEKAVSCGCKKKKKRQITLTCGEEQVEEDLILDKKETFS